MKSPFQISANFDTQFDLCYRHGELGGDSFFQKGAAKQWDALTDLDWSVGFDIESPLEYDDRFLPAYGSPHWERADEKRKTEIRSHFHSYSISQFLHGEQAAMISAARLVEVLPDISSKQFAAQQASDEARHVQVFNKLVKEHLPFKYDIDRGVQDLIREGLSDSRWDFVVLTTQILIEGLALGALQQLRDLSKNRLVRQATGYIMADEARHVAFGLKALEVYYQNMSDLEKRERIQFVEAGLLALRNRINPGVVWSNLGLDPAIASEHLESDSMPRVFGRLFSRLGLMLERLGLTVNPLLIRGSSEGLIRSSERLKIFGATDERYGFAGKWR
jgi:P-aminobenzoate N-oxygenase AurF